MFPLPQYRAIRAAWPHPRFFNLYGPTETNVCTWYEVPAAAAAIEGMSTFPIGALCVPNRGMVVAEDGAVVKTGDPGELLISGPNVMRGYWNLPLQNERAFHIDATGAKWYRTGDIVTESESGFRYVSRRDRMVKRRGYRVELGEIETVLSRHKDIREAAVVAIPDAESGVRVCAFVAAHEGSTLTRIALKTASSKSLPPYMIPDQFFIAKDGEDIDRQDRLPDSEERGRKSSVAAKKALAAWRHRSLSQRTSEQHGRPRKHLRGRAVGFTEVEIVPALRARSCQLVDVVGHDELVGKVGGIFPHRNIRMFGLQDAVYPEPHYSIGLPGSVWLDVHLEPIPFADAYRGLSADILAEARKRPIEAPVCVPFQVLDEIRAVRSPDIDDELVAPQAVLVLQVHDCDLVHALTIREGESRIELHIELEPEAGVDIQRLPAYARMISKDEVLVIVGSNAGRHDRLRGVPALRSLGRGDGHRSVATTIPLAEVASLNPAWNGSLVAASAVAPQ
ncbi:MAG: AMP-binding protein [Proteobacteria bacterium]|nr:AMP-binding protein [Pseudomonadota bacterium]